MVKLFGLNTSERRCMCVYAFSVSFIARLPSDCLIGKDIVLIF